MIRHSMVEDLLWELGSEDCSAFQRSREHLEWLNSELLDIVEEFVKKNRLQESYFVTGMNNTFKTTRFELLLKRWLVEYLEKLFRRLDDFKDIMLEDNVLNRFGVERYGLRFEILPKIKWRSPSTFFQRLYSILLRSAIILYFSLNNGLKIYGERKRYKVLREALWGLYDRGGYYRHDDFLVDGDMVKKEDILLFSRGIPTEGNRLKAYHDAKKSPYAHFDLSSLSLGLRPLFSRIIPKYIISGSRLLFKEMSSRHFSLYWSIYLCFIYNALPYEKVFSHFEVISELAHNWFTAGHIPEAIICQNYGTRYYFMNWSDLSNTISEHLLSFLGCDGYLLWGKVHFTGTQGDSRILLLTGYPFKKFIKKVRFNRDKVLSDMGISAKGKIVTFFDESFGGECKMTGENFITLWETAFKLAQIEEGNTILIKSKTPYKYNKLSDGLKRRFTDLKNKIDKTLNIYIVDGTRWSFIECIGISDIVVTQGMTSSSTIAIICGIEGLYLDQAQYVHPFSKLFKDRIVFDDAEKLLSMINRIIKGTESPLKDIPEKLSREFDAYPDDRGIDLFRSILSGQMKGINKDV